MARILHSALFLAPLTALGQTLVSPLPENRTVLIEDLTGVNCQYCPDGHTIMNAIHAAEPHRVSLLAIHAGAFATAAWTTPWGNAVNSFYSPAGYPSGGVNRHDFGSGRALDRGAWTPASAEVLGMSSPVNLGLASSYDADTRTATITVELLYTANSPGGTDRLTVVLAESGIVAAQASTSGTIPNYVHNHVFRTVLTPNWGDEVTTTSAGDTYTTTYTYVLPESADPTKFEVTAFIGENQSDVYQARTVAFDGGATWVPGSLQDLSGTVDAGQGGQATTFEAQLNNHQGAASDFLITLSAESAPTDWTGVFSAAGQNGVSTATVTLEEALNTTIDVSITPGSTAGIGSYRLDVSSVDLPDAPTMTIRYKVISGVTDLIVSNSVAPATTAEARYISGLQAAGNTSFAATDRESFVRFFDSGALSGVINIYRNVSWTFPSLVDAEVAALEEMMDDGVNLFIAGQDIGWDQSGAAQAYGTTATRAFYTNYMLATFVNDGNTSNTPVNFADDDAVFGALANSAIANVFSGNTYPEQITPIPPATAIFNYGTTVKIGGLRAQTANYKLVYLGVGPEQLAVASVATDVVRLSHDWFYGLVSVDDLGTNDQLGMPYPVPTNGLVTIPTNGLRTAAVISIVDATGRMVLQRNVAAHSPQVQLDLSGLPNGIYLCRLDDGQRASSRPIQVQH